MHLVPEKRKCLSATWANFTLATWQFRRNFLKDWRVSPAKNHAGNIKCLPISLAFLLFSGGGGGVEDFQPASVCTVFTGWTAAHLLPQTKLWFLPVIFINFFLFTEKTLPVSDSTESARPGSKIIRWGASFSASFYIIKKCYFLIWFNCTMTRCQRNIVRFISGDKEVSCSAVFFKYDNFSEQIFLTVYTLLIIIYILIFIIYEFHPFYPNHSWLNLLRF